MDTATRNALIKAAEKRDGRKCWLCAGPFEATGPLRLTLEHLTPRSHGGTDDHGNIYLAHQQCNVLLGDMTRREKVRFKRGLAFAVRPSALPLWKQPTRATA